MSSIKITLTFDDNSVAPSTMSLSADVVASLEQFRQGQLSSYMTTDEHGNSTMKAKPMYSDVGSMLAAAIKQSVITPALNQFPTTAIQNEQATIAASQTNITKIISDSCTITNE